MGSIAKLVGNPISQEANIKDASKGFLIVQNPEDPENNRELTYAKLSQMYELTGLIIVGSSNPPASDYTTDASLGAGNYFPVGTTYINNSVTPNLLWRLTKINSTSDVVWTKIANIESPEFTGTPTSPTPPDGDNSTKIANTEYVKREINKIPDSPSIEDTTISMNISGSGNNTGKSLKITLGGITKYVFSSDSACGCTCTCTCTCTCNCNRCGCNWCL